MPSLRTASLTVFLLTSLHATVRAEELITAVLHADDKRIVLAQLESIRELIKFPEKSGNLVTEDLQLIECIKVSGGIESCNFWDPYADNGRTMTLANLYLYSRHQRGDAGGQASWNVDRHVCISPTLLAQVFKSKPTRLGMLPQDFFGSEPDNSPPPIQFKFDALNPKWGTFEMKYIDKGDCVVSISVEWRR